MGEKERYKYCSLGAQEPTPVGGGLAPTCVWIATLYVVLKRTNSTQFTCLEPSGSTTAPLALWGKRPVLIRNNLVSLGLHSLIHRRSVLKWPGFTGSNGRGSRSRW